MRYTKFSICTTITMFGVSMLTKQPSAASTSPWEHDNETAVCMHVTMEA